MTLLQISPGMIIWNKNLKIIKFHSNDQADSELSRMPRLHRGCKMQPADQTQQCAKNAHCFLSVIHYQKTHS